MIRDLSMGKRGDAELYDIVHDPLCMNNLHGVAEYGVLEKTLEKEMTERLKSQGDPRMYGGVIFLINIPTCVSQGCIGTAPVPGRKSPQPG